MKRHSVIALIALMVTLFIAPQVMAGGDKTHTPSAADRRKAEYIFVNAQRAKVNDELDAFFDQLQYAHRLDPTNSAIAFYLGYCLISMDNATRADGAMALDLMKQHYEASPGDYYETTLYSDANMMMGQPDEALRALQTLDRRNPNRLEIQSRLAEAYTRVGDYRGAIATYDTIEALNEVTMGTITKKVDCYLALGDSTTAVEQMHRLLDKAPRNGSYNVAMAGLMYDLHNPDSAVYYLDRAIEYEPDNGHIYLSRAQYFNLTGDSAAYDHEVFKALTTDNLDVDSKVGVLTAYTRQLLSNNDSTQRVNNLFRVLIDQHPHEATIREIYSEYLVVREDYKGAAEQLGYALDINPTDAGSWRRLMLVNMMDENFPAAIAAAQRALEYNPDSLDLYRYIAPAYYQMKEYEKALETYNKALEHVDSTDVELQSDILGGMADVYFSQGDTLRAFDTYEEALRIFPANTGIMNNYAYFLSLSDRDLDKAERMAAMAVKYNPTSATFLDTYAWVYFKKREYTLALMYIKSAMDNDDTHSSDILEHYGDILFMNGRPDEAVEQWQRALELDPDNELLQRKVAHRTYFYK